MSSEVKVRVANRLPNSMPFSMNTPQSELPCCLGYFSLISKANTSFSNVNIERIIGCCYLTRNLLIFESKKEFGSFSYARMLFKYSATTASFEYASDLGTYMLS